jgi:hypothetical protein
MPYEHSIYTAAIKESGKLTTLPSVSFWVHAFPNWDSSIAPLFAHNKFLADKWGGSE